MFHPLPVLLDPSSIPDFSEATKTLFLSLMLSQSILIRKGKIQEAIEHLQANTNRLSEIDLLKREISKLETLPLAEVAEPIENEYDWKWVANHFSEISPLQCSWAWKFFLHPTINKSNWDQLELDMIISFATHSRFTMQDWDEDAKYLKTGRTGFQCFLAYCAMRGPLHRQWGFVDTRFLCEVIDFFGEGFITHNNLALNWERVGSFMLSARNNEDKPMRMRMPYHFSSREDIIMLDYIETNGMNFLEMNSNFLRMTYHIPGKLQIEFKCRYEFILQHRLYKIWKVEEDRKLIHTMENTSDYILSVLPERKQISRILSRYNMLKKWEVDHPGLDISLAPRRMPKEPNDYDV